MDDRDLERWAEEVLRPEPEPIRAPAGFADRVMARVTTTAVEPSRAPAWFVAASDPIVAVGLTAALVLALAASWWPGRIWVRRLSCPRGRGTAPRASPGISTPRPSSRSSR